MVGALLALDFCASSQGHLAYGHPVRDLCKSVVQSLLLFSGIIAGHGDELQR